MRMEVESSTAGRKRAAFSRVWVIAVAVGILWGSADPAGARAAEGTPSSPGANLSAERTWGLGVRFVPSLFSPPPPGPPDAELGSAAVVRFWLMPTLAVEAGGWFAYRSDRRSESSLTLLTAGLLLKLVDGPRSDLYLAGRGLHARRISREKGIFFAETPAAPSEGEPPGEARPCCPPMESESLTLGLELALGAEWSLSPQLAVEVEGAMIYAQTALTQWGIVPLPLSPQGPVALPIGEGETSTSLSWGIALRIGLSFYFPPPTPQRGAELEPEPEGG